MKQVAQTRKYELSMEDIQEAVTDYLEKKRIQICGDVNINPIYTKDAIPRGMFDCDYIDVFSGIEVTVKEI